MKVLVISSSYPSSEGDHSGHFVQAEVQALRLEGHEVLVMSPGGASGLAKDDHTHITLGGTELFCAPGAWPNLTANPKLFKEFLRASARVASWALARRTSSLLRPIREPALHFYPDRIVTHWLIPGAFPWGMFVHQDGVQFEVVVHGSDLHLLLALPRFVQKLLLQQLYHRGASLRFVSEALKSELLSRSHSSPIRQWLESAEVRPARLDLSAAPSRSDARASLNLASRELVLVIVGRMISQKRIEVAINAASLVPGAKVFVIGDGPLSSHLKAQFGEATFLGTLPRALTLHWIAAADLLINASRLEGAPTTIREALVLGTEVISTDVADLKSWAASGTGLWLVP